MSRNTFKFNYKKGFNTVIGALVLGCVFFFTPAGKKIYNMIMLEYRVETLEIGQARSSNRDMVQDGLLEMLDKQDNMFYSDLLEIKQTMITREEFRDGMNDLKKHFSKELCQLSEEVNMNIVVDDSSNNPQLYVENKKDKYENNN